MNTFKDSEVLRLWWKGAWFVSSTEMAVSLPGYFFSHTITKKGKYYCLSIGEHVRRFYSLDSLLKAIKGAVK